MSASGTFFKGAEDKYGIEFTPIRHGKYKSAIEPFLRKDFSPENREQLGALIKVIWDDMLKTVASSRKMTPEQLQALVDKEGLISAKSAKEQGLVTELAYEGQAVDKARELTGKKPSDKTFPQVTIGHYVHEGALKAALHQHGKDKIAVVYAEGEIINGSQGEDGQVAGEKFAQMIRKLRQNKDVKALVLRVNSPGGSGQASDEILEELRRFDKDRPVIVSMGGYAASGGYYISMASRRILAEPNTITGSIGVFGLAMNVEKLANDHGITFDSIKTGALAQIGTIARPMTDEEHTVIQNVIDHFYEEFLQRVATGRKLTTNQVDAIAQGRVWSGEDALKIGLVDELGGLQKAIGVAAQQAGVGTNYSVLEYPEKKEFFQRLAESLERKEQPLARNDFASRVVEKIKVEWQWLAGFNDPQGVYARLPYELELN
jgi:protease-4